MRRGARSLWLLAGVASLACAYARDYRDPDPTAVQTALVVIENPSWDPPPVSRSSAAVHVYEGADDCSRRYVGSVNMNALQRSILVVADRRALFHFSISADSVTCDVEVGFLPRAGGQYQVIIRERTACEAEVRLQSGEAVAAFDPRACEPQ